MNALKRILGNDWDIIPAGGLTGDAYVAINNDRRLFLKRNSSPFLAVLSAEGIVPKLVWTKRMENGDVITAQEWLEGRALEPEEMREDDVISVIKRIHTSSELLQMLTRLGKKRVIPNERYALLQTKFKTEETISKYKEVQEAMAYLAILLPEMGFEEAVVCHGDLNHNNLIRTTGNKVYLIDWDNTMIADPAADLGMILEWYIPQQDWHKWLDRYGMESNDSFFKRMYWYLLMDALYYILWHGGRKELNRVEERLKALRHLNARTEQLLR